jgi:hypothetical protein
MAAENEHSRIIAAAARAALEPHGFWRKGRSRIWLADRGYWLAVVEFQPSGFSKGSYLNLAAHWFWSAMPDVLSFDYIPEGGKPWVAFETPAQFEQAATELSNQALNKLGLLDSLFPNPHAIAAALTRRAAAAGGGVTVWNAFNAAVAAGLVGDLSTANELMNVTHAKLATWRPDLQLLIESYQAAMSNLAEFRVFVGQRIEDQRARYGCAGLADAGS